MMPIRKRLASLVGGVVRGAVEHGSGLADDINGAVEQ
jgi:hypothetical protein